MSALHHDDAARPAGTSGPMSAAAFQEMVDGRPDGERWQLIDGEALLMMNPPSFVHQRIGFNLATRLNDAFEAIAQDCFAMLEIGLMVDGVDGFRAVADVAVVDGEVQAIHYGSNFRLAAEVLSPSNTQEKIGRKRELYAQAPSCLHVLILRQDEPCVEVWSRSNGWQGRVFRSMDDRIELPEFGFSCRLAELYKGTPVG